MSASFAPGACFYFPGEPETHKDPHPHPDSRPWVPGEKPGSHCLPRPGHLAPRDAPCPGRGRGEGGGARSVREAASSPTSAPMAPRWPGAWVPERTGEGGSLGPREGGGGSSLPPRAARAWGSGTSRATLRSAGHDLGEQKRELLPAREPEPALPLALPGYNLSRTCSGGGGGFRGGSPRASLDTCRSPFLHPGQRPGWGQERGSLVPEGASSVEGPPGAGRFSARHSDIKS